MPDSTAYGAWIESLREPAQTKPFVEKVEKSPPYVLAYVYPPNEDKLKLVFDPAPGTKLNPDHLEVLFANTVGA